MGKRRLTHSQLQINSVNFDRRSKSSVTRWLDFWFNIWQFRIIINDQYHKNAKLESKFCQMVLALTLEKLPKTIKICQTGEISPILVTLSKGSSCIWSCHSSWSSTEPTRSGGRGCSGIVRSELALGTSASRGSDLRSWRAWSGPRSAQCKSESRPQSHPILYCPQSRRRRFESL